MIFGLFTLAVAITISGVGAFYSIIGLTAIFAAAFWPIVVMGTVLEIGKITATVWLHQYWHRASLQFKTYLVPAILVLMLITSMGIFGFLSKAHLDQSVPAGDIVAKVTIIDERINTERENIQSQRDNISAAKAALTQLDTQVTEMLGRTTDDRGANRAVQIRRQQAKERASLQKEIAQAQKEIETLNAKIAQLNEEKAPLAAEVRKVEAEVGPIKYIAALIYGDNPDANLLENAVRWIIILLVLVFDPLALVLIMAGQQAIMWSREDKINSSNNKPLDTATELSAELERVKKERDLLFQAHSVEMTRADELANMIDDTQVEQSYLKKPWSWIPASTRGLVATPDTAESQSNSETSTDKQLEEIKAQSDVDQDMKMREEYDFSNATRGPVLDKETQEFFDRGKEIARKLDQGQPLQEESKKKDSNVDRTTRNRTNKEIQRALTRPISYVQNSEQNEKTLWQRVKDSKKDV